jgi:cell division protein ZapA
MSQSAKQDETAHREKRSVKLELYGQRFSVRTDDAEEYLQKLARFVNEKMTEIRSATGRVETSQIALLALLDISDALYRERAKNKALKVDVLARSERILHAIDDMASALEVREAVVQVQAGAAQDR